MAERVEQDPHSDRRDRHEPLERGHGLRVSRCGGNGPVSAWPVSVGTLVLAVALLGAEGVAEAQQAAATPPATPAPARSRLAAVTLPDLGTLESEVATQISGVHKDLEALRAKDTVSDAELGESYGMLGQLLHAYELFEPASLCYGNALLLTPGEYRWLHLRGDAEKRRGNLAEARPLLQAAAELRPREVASLVSVGEVALELNDMALAKRAFTQALSVAPGLPAALAGLGQVAVVEQDYPAAVAYLEGALRAVPEANRLHYPLALAYRALGKVDEARQHMEQRGSVGIRVLDPLVDELKNLARGERFHALRARLLFGNGLYAEAAKEFVAAVQLNPQSVPSLINLGVTLARLGDNASAIERLRQALALAP
jgi:tetratricopeptide (TPR) repeat protein